MELKHTLIIIVMPTLLHKIPSVPTNVVLSGCELPLSLLYGRQFICWHMLCLTSASEGTFPEFGLCAILCRHI